MTTLSKFFGGGGSAVDPGSILVSAGGDYEPVDADDVRLGTTFGDGGSETGTLVVEGGTTPPPSAATATGYTHTMQHGVVVADVPVSVRLEDGPGTAGLALIGEVWTETSDETGYVEFVGLLRGGTYVLWVGCATLRQVTFTVPDEETFALDEVIGSV